MVGLAGEHQALAILAAAAVAWSEVSMERVPTIFIVSQRPAGVSLGARDTSALVVSGGREIVGPNTNKFCCWAVAF